MSQLAVFNNLLVSNTSLLSLCCCGSTGNYWEAIPCDLSKNPRLGQCAEWDPCQFDKRVFVKEVTRCDGPGSKICECQRLFLYD
ncbi:MAG: hypothetical protein EBS07_12320, partial [Sphingobacteriia bacterium]|nr:hypothetical protein [Sphingobacteriia bacterium]